jgi:hypothetical protein
MECFSAKGHDRRVMKSSNKNIGSWDVSSNHLQTVGQRSKTKIKVSSSIVCFFIIVVNEKKGCPHPQLVRKGKLPPSLMIPPLGIDEELLGEAVGEVTKLP